MISRGEIEFSSLHQDLSYIGVRGGGGGLYSSTICHNAKVTFFILVKQWNQVKLL